MAKKRGFAAELNRQIKLSNQRSQQAQRAAARSQAAAARQAEQAHRASERARTQLAKATAAQQKQAEQEARRLHVESMIAQTESLNADLADTYDGIDSILQATLDVDDYVDLEQLRVIAEHPPFPRPDLLQQPPPPLPLTAPPEPQYVEPVDSAKGLAKIGAKKRHAEQVAAAQSDYTSAHQQWQATVAQLPVLQRQQMEEYQRHEELRLQWVAQVQQEWGEECRQLDLQADASNAELDQLIAGIANNDESAVQEYVAIVLSNSVYPEAFEVDHDFTYDSDLRELDLTLTVPAPDTLPVVKEYKYVKSKDEITSTELTQKDRKTRYANAVHQVAIRSLHEVFEADRAERIQTIALSVGTDTIDSATGLPTRTVLVAAAADRSSFITYDLANVVPLDTLKHLNALVSKNPFDLVGVDQSKGVRG